MSARDAVALACSITQHTSSKMLLDVTILISIYLSPAESIMNLLLV
jgi:hypothetical protein